VAVLAVMNGLRLAADDPKPAAKANEAERLFRQMERKLAESKVIECVIESKPAPGLGAAGTVRLRLAGGNKLRLEIECTVDGAKQRSVIISDGTKMVAEGDGLGIGDGNKPIRRIEWPVPKSLNQEVVKVLTLAGERTLWRGVINPDQEEVEGKH